jgi:two-component system OmpR family response regulator
MRILIVEDDEMLAEAVTRAMRQSAHVVQRAATGPDADRILSATEFDLVILDLGLPELDGFEVLKRLRGRRERVPVLVLTVRDSVEDRVAGLDFGADDYMTKPFELAELEARVRALIRRANSGTSSDLHHGPLRLDTAGRRLYCDNQPLELSARELSVIELLMLREGRVVTKQHIIDHLYGWDEGASGNSVEVFVYRLRRKLEGSGVDIRTVRGMGYLIERPNAG